MGFTVLKGLQPRLHYVLKLTARPEAVPLQDFTPRISAACLAARDLGQTGIVLWYVRIAAGVAAREIVQDDESEYKWLLKTRNTT
jgi:hypothetical protein